VVVTDGDGEDWWESVEELVLEHQRVRRLQNLERLTKMRRASFCDNELTRVEGLECCTGLEELSLEGNRITAVEGLSTLINLKTLDLGKNKIPQVGTNSSTPLVAWGLGLATVHRPAHRRAARAGGIQ
jgi:Leucine-rich repeat (LRR) protein